MSSFLFARDSKTGEKFTINKNKIYYLYHNGRLMFEDPEEKDGILCIYLDEDDFIEINNKLLNE